MDEPKTLTFFQIVEEVLKNGNSNPEYLNILDNYSTDFTNFNKCKEILENTENNIYIRTFASQTILNLAQLNLSNWKIDFAIKLCDWSINYMIKNCLEPERIIFSSLSELVALVLEYFWIVSNTICMSEWNEIIQIFDNEPDEWIPALFLITSIQDKFTKSKDEKVVDLFAKNCLLTSFRLAYNCAKRIRNSSLPNFEFILDMSLNLIERCIYNRLNETELCDITYEKQISFYFEIYNSFHIFSVLKCLYAIASSIYILGCKNNSKIIEQLCVGFQNILHENIDVIDCGHLDYILEIISKLASYLRYSVIQQMVGQKTVEDFIRMMADLTNIMIQQNQNLVTIKIIISFWTNIEAALRNDGNIKPKILISNFAPQLCINYINYLLALQNFNFKNESSMQSQCFNNDILEIMENVKIGKISQYIFPIQNFVILSPDAICPQLLLGLTEKRNELVSCLENSTDATIAEAQLAFFVEIATVVVLIKASGINQDSKIKYHPDFFIRIIALLRESAGWASNGILFPRLEMSLILFITQFKNTLFGSQLSKNLYSQLKRKRSFSSFEECQSFLLNRAITTLRYFNDQILISQALSIVHNNNSSSSKKTLNILFGSPFEQSFPFLNAIENRSLRVHFFATIYSIIAKMIKSSDFSFLTKLLDLLDSKFQSVSVNNIVGSDEIKKEITFLAIDICGIFNEAKENISFEPLFEWFISNDKSKLFETSFTYLINENNNNSNNNNVNGSELINDIVIFCILKMWKSIVLCTPPKRIVFGPSSTNGIIIFKMAAALLTQYCNHIHSRQNFEELTEFKIKGIKYVFLILQNLISGMYVPFYAFKIYNDTIFVDLLNLLATMINEHFIKFIEQCPSIFKVMIHLFRDLMVYQFETLLEKVNPLVIMILNCSIKMLVSNDEEIEQWACDAILAFLRYFYEFGLDFKSFQDQVNIINLMLWNKIINEGSIISAGIVDPLKYLYLLDSQYLIIVKEKIRPNLSNHKVSVIDEYFTNLESFFTVNDLQTININDVIKCIGNIVDAMRHSHHVVFI